MRPQQVATATDCSAAAAQDDCDAAMHNLGVGAKCRRCHLPREAACQPLPQRCNEGGSSCTRHGCLVARFFIVHAQLSCCKRQIMRLLSRSGTVHRSGGERHMPAPTSHQRRGGRAPLSTLPCIGSTSLAAERRSTRRTPRVGQRPCGSPAGCWIVLPGGSTLASTTP